MINYSETAAKRIIDFIIVPVLKVLATGPWSLIVFPTTNKGYAPVYKNLEDWNENKKDAAKVHRWSSNTFSWDTDITSAIYTLFIQNLSYWVRDNSDIKICILKDDSVRVRFANGLTAEEKVDAVEALKTEIKNNISYPEDLPEVPAKVKECNVIKGEKKMNSFSLTNLKDALVNKITHLDKKTITILALIALVLLVVGKYQDIKDILVGIKNKVKRSKNFKAMVADGTAAIDSLKKIVGVKDNKETTNEA